jgi:PPOX class probable FMN-dependent enzyme
MSHFIDTEQDLQALFAPVGEASVRKEVDYLHPVYREWIAASPFVLLATSGSGGLDVSPRGDPAPVVRIVDDKTLLLPERRGNNRIDSLRNIVHDPRVALLFLIPGTGETLRVNGTARISVEPELLNSFAVGGALPKCVLQITVSEVFFHCARAMQRSGLWAKCVKEGDAKARVPTAGEILSALSQGQLGGEKYDADLPDRQRSTLY